MTKTYRNDHSFELVIGSHTVRPGAEIELDGYTGDMLASVDADPVLEPSTEYEEAAVEAKPKRSKKAAAEPEVE
jgi:hypothetical protein